MLRILRPCCSSVSINKNIMYSLSIYNFGFSKGTKQKQSFCWMTNTFLFELLLLPSLDLWVRPQTEASWVELFSYFSCRFLYPNYFPTWIIFVLKCKRMKYKREMKCKCKKKSISYIALLGQKPFRARFHIF